MQCFNTLWSTNSLDQSYPYIILRYEITLGSTAVLGFDDWWHKHSAQSVIIMAVSFTQVILEHSDNVSSQGWGRSDSKQLLILEFLLNRNYKMPTIMFMWVEAEVSWWWKCNNDCVIEVLNRAASRECYTNINTNISEFSQTRVRHVLCGYRISPAACLLFLLWPEASIRRDTHTYTHTRFQKCANECTCTQIAPTK